MRAVRVSGPGDVAVADVAAPEPAAGEVLVEVIATAVCSTDRKFAARAHEQPRTPGHEVTGRLGDGTIVGVHPEVVCGTCAACRDGWHNRCPYRQSIGLALDGGLAGYVAVPASQVVPLGDLDPVIATMLEPLACAIHAIDTAVVDPAAPAVVVGAGAMGVLCGWVLQEAGAPVVLCQRSLPRRDLARGLGFDAVIGPDDDPGEHLDGPPATVVVTAPGGAPLTWALERVAVGGVVHAFAGTPGGAEVDANLVHYRHLRLTGSTGSRLRDYRRAVELATAGVVKLERLPHQVVALDDAPAALLGKSPDDILKTIVAVA